MRKIVWLLASALLLHCISAEGQIRFRLPKFLKARPKLPSSTPHVRDNLVFEATFEGVNPLNDFEFDGTSQNCCDAGTPACCSYTLLVTTAQARTGTKSLQTEVRSTTPPVSGGYRSEVVPDAAGQPGSTFDTGERWYGLSMYFEVPVSGGLWTGSYNGHFLQWHPENGGGSLSFGLWGEDGIWDLVTNPEGDETAVHHAPGNVGIIGNMWHDVVIHVNWTSGLTEMWLNGDLFYSGTINWNGAGFPGRYLKIGQNRWGSCSGAPCDTWRIFYDDIRIGNASATYEDVAP